MIDGWVAVIIICMRIMLTKFGLPQVVVFPVAVLLLMVVCVLLPLSFAVVCVLEIVLGSVLVWALAFFRDPYRDIPVEKDVLLSPADGKVTDIEVVENDFIGGKALKIGIFLNVFNVHINRAPCDVTVEKISYKKGKYKNAMSPDSARVNESNDVYLSRVGGDKEKLIVRQISGAIARRIVCEIQEGQKLDGGEKFGMIKFGSRTELYLPNNERAKAAVKIGDKVKAGSSILIRYDKCQD